MTYKNNCKVIRKLRNIALVAATFTSLFLVSYSVQAAMLTNDQTLNSIGWTVDGKKVKSGSLSTDYTIQQVLIDVDKFKLNTLNIPVMVNINDTNSSSMLVDKTSESKAIELITQLKNSNKNINIILEPYPWIANGMKAETEWKPGNMDFFFQTWKTNVLKTLIDDIAVPYNVTALNIGSNFVNMESRENDWCDIVYYVREHYKGLVTYRTNKWDTASWAPDSITAYNNKLNNKLFSKVDFISIASYFELTDNATNTVENLSKSIENSQISISGNVRHQNIKQEIKNFYDKWNKPIFFGELGFPKFNYASHEPWNWNPYNNNNSITGVEQANCFEAYRREFENEPWFLGFSIFAIGEQSNDKHYYPSQQSTVVIRNWYSNER